MLPLLNEANRMGHQLGRCVRFEAALVTYVPQSMAFSPVEELPSTALSTADPPFHTFPHRYVPQSMAFSPVEELLTQKVTELRVPP